MKETLLTIVEKVDNSPYHLENGVYRFESHDGVLLGKVTAAACEVMRNVSWLQVDATTVRIKDAADLDAKFAALTAQWHEQKTFACLAGWRDELYTCFTLDGEKYFDIERAAACIFGIVTYGCHITGYIPTTKQVWVPRRAYTKPTYPGMLDNTVAGGLGDGIGYLECAIKECEEEASIGGDYARSHLLPAGAVLYEFVDPDTGFYQPEVECVYDMPMEPGVEPRVNDGEVHEFRLMSYEEVLARMRAGEFKYNCAVVLVDFLIRHGEITAENEPRYLEVLSRTHRRLEYPLKQ